MKLAKTLVQTLDETSLIDQKKVDFPFNPNQQDKNVFKYTQC